MHSNRLHIMRLVTLEHKVRKGGTDEGGGGVAHTPVSRNNALLLL